MGAKEAKECIKIWKLCIDKNINQTQLRELSGLIPTVIARLSKGEVVEIQSYLQIADALKYSIADLVDSVSNEKSPQKIITTIIKRGSKPR